MGQPDRRPVKAGPSPDEGVRPERGKGPCGPASPDRGSARLGAEPGSVALAGVAASRRWTVRHDARPWTTNAERRWHHHERARIVAEWRRAFGVLARSQRIPRLGAVEVTAVPYLRSRRGMQDVGGCFPAVKAAVDGLVDAGVLAGDGPDVVRALTFRAPVVGRGDALELVVEGVAS